MTFPQPLPGNPRHQLILRTILDYYQADPRILAVIIFGSLGRGNWDRFSDLDLDFIVADDTHLNVLEELKELCAALMNVGEPPAIILPDDDDAGDVVFESLMQISARYHPLASTKPAILESMRILAGRLTVEQVIAAGLANRREDPPVEELLDHCLRYAAVADVYIQRGRLWGSLELLHRMRTLLMEIYSRTHGGVRGFQAFEETASKSLQGYLAETLPQASPESLRMALLRLLSLIQDDFDSFAGGQVSLSHGQKVVLEAVKRNQRG